MKLTIEHQDGTQGKANLTEVMNVKKYNGWTNYETWLLKLWQDNEQGEQEYWREQARDHIAVSEPDHACLSLADAMKEHYEKRASELIGVTGFWADLMGAALSEVNWFEIAEHWIDEVKEETEVA